MSNFFLTAGIVFLAELGDKTQLLAMCFVAKYGALQVFAGISTAIVLNSALAVIIGEGLSRVVPFATLQIIAGIGFLGFGLWSLRSDDEECEASSVTTRSPFWTIFVAFFVAELGDKTQLVTMGLAAQQGSPFTTFLGASLGLIAAGALGIFLGKFITRLVPPRAMKLGAAAVFLFFGTLSLYNNVAPELLSLPIIFLYFLGLASLSYVIIAKRL